MAHLSLEPFLNRKRLFVRVQASISRELFVQKLNSAFPGARIGVGNINAERGPVTQRVADINFDTASEAQQASVAVLCNKDKQGRGRGRAPAVTDLHPPRPPSTLNPVAGSQTQSLQAQGRQP